VVEVSKRTITRVFLGSTIAFVAGLILLLVAASLGYARDGFMMHGPDVMGVRSNPFGWSAVALTTLAVLVMLGAAVAQFIAWVGALMATVQLDDKTWFVVLLVLGLISFGFLSMLAYVVAGPDDGTRPGAGNLGRISPPRLPESEQARELTGEFDPRVANGGSS